MTLVNSSQQRERYRALKVNRLMKKVTITCARSIVRQNIKLARDINPNVAKLLGRESMIGGFKLLFMNLRDRRRYLAIQKLLGKFLKKLITSSEIPSDIPRSLKRVLTRSQIRLLAILVIHKKMMIDAVLKRERVAIARARALNARHDSPEIDVTVTPELTDMIKGRLSMYRSKLEDASKRAKGKWSAMELDRFKANISYSRDKAISLWESKYM